MNANEKLTNLNKKERAKIKSKNEKEYNQAKLNSLKKVNRLGRNEEEKSVFRNQKVK